MFKFQVTAVTNLGAFYNVTGGVIIGRKQLVERRWIVCRYENYISTNGLRGFRILKKMQQIESAISLIENQHADAMSDD